MTDTVRTFRLNRKEDASGVSGTGIVAVGALFPSGRCVIEWLPGRVDVRSFNIYGSIDEIRLVNGHDGRTVIEFDDEQGWWQCGCGIRNCTRHERPAAPNWKLYHPISSRVDDALVRRGLAMTCAHLDFAAHVSVNRFEDTGRFSADITVKCALCSEPFRFLGVPAGLSWEHPAVSIDGLELRAPIEPEGEKMLHSRSTFQMPAELAKQEAD